MTDAPFIRITADRDDVYALDTEGVIWPYDWPAKEWFASGSKRRRPSPDPK